jgi:hypothetical protein
LIIFYVCWSTITNDWNAQLLCYSTDNIFMHWMSWSLVLLSVEQTWEMFWLRTS